MKKNHGLSLFVLATLALTYPGLTHGQDFFRDLGASRSSGGYGPVYPSDYSYQDGVPSGMQELQPQQELALPGGIEEDQKYNFAIGQFRFGLAAGVGVEWNDNIRLSENNRQSDFIFRPVLNLDSTWRISDLNTLRFNIGVSYAKYLDHSELDTDGILIAPNSELALSFYVGSVKFTVRDRISYQEDTYDVAPLSGVAVYGRWENQAGIDMDWKINESLGLILGSPLQFVG